MLCLYTRPLTKHLNFNEGRKQENTKLEKKNINMIITKQGELNVARVFIVKNPGPRNSRSKTPLKTDLTLLLKFSPKLGFSN